MNKKMNHTQWSRVLSVAAVSLLALVSSTSQSFSSTSSLAEVAKVKPGLKATSNSENIRIIANFKKNSADGSHMGPPQCYKLFTTNSDKRWGAFVYGQVASQECQPYLADGVVWIHLIGQKWISFGNSSYLEHAECVSQLKKAKVPKSVALDYLASSFGPCV